MLFKLFIEYVGESWVFFFGRMSLNPEIVDGIVELLLWNFQYCIYRTINGVCCPQL